jgi:stage IV sporulation protein FB
MRIGWIRGCELRVHPLLLVLFLLAALVGQLPVFALAFIAVLYHELCHVLAARLCGYKVSAIEILPFGSVAQIQGLFEGRPQQEMVIALAGPASNLLMVMIHITLEHYTHYQLPYQQRFVDVNLQLAIFNLLPALPLDGGRVLRSALARVFSLVKATRWAADLGIVMGMIITGAGILCWGRVNNAPMAVWMGAFLTLVALKERRTATWIWLKEMTGKKQQLLLEETMAVRQIIARWDLPLGELARRFIPHRYHLVLVVDEQFNPLGSVSENQVVEALLSKGPTVQIGAIIPGKG